MVTSSLTSSNYLCYFSIHVTTILPEVHLMVLHPTDVHLWTSCCHLNTKIMKTRFLMLILKSSPYLNLLVNVAQIVTSLTLWKSKRWCYLQIDACCCLLSYSEALDILGLDPLGSWFLLIPARTQSAPQLFDIRTFPLLTPAQSSEMICRMEVCRSGHGLDFLGHKSIFLNGEVLCLYHLFIFYIKCLLQK